MDRFGLLPPGIRANYEREEMVDGQLRAAQALATALKAFDPRCELQFISGRAEPIYGIVPGRWHVVRRNDPPNPDTYIPITTPDGGYREPDSGVLTELQRRDLWARPVDDFLSKQRSDDLLREQRIYEAAAEVRAALRVPGEGGMTKRLWGKK